MAEDLAYPFIGHNGWDDHVQDVADVLAPLLAPGIDVEDRMVYIDTFADVMCKGHVAILLNVLSSTLAGLEFDPADLGDLVKPWRGRPAETLPWPIGRPAE